MKEEIKIKAWAIYCKTLPPEDAIVDVQFIGCSDEEAKSIHMNKSMFVDDNGRPNWTNQRYKLVSCTVSYVLPGKKKQS